MVQPSWENYKILYSNCKIPKCVRLVTNVIEIDISLASILSCLFSHSYITMSQDVRGLKIIILLKIHFSPVFGITYPNELFFYCRFLEDCDLWKILVVYRSYSFKRYIQISKPQPFPNFYQKISRIPRGLPRGASLN